MTDVGQQSFKDELSGRVCQGTCGWSDASIVSCNRFYPPSVKTSADKLKVFSKTFQCVEVDSSCYAIPAPAAVCKWVASVPPGFKFHFKAFGLFCSQGSTVANLPRAAKELLSSSRESPSSHASPYIKQEHMPPPAVQACWDLFHASIQPAVSADKMGAVLFQFHLSFGPSETNRRYVESCRKKLRADVEMAVEFRSRQWFQTSPAASSCRAWLAGLGISMVAADELVHETAQRDRAQSGLPPGHIKQLLPVALEVASPSFFYVRIHRRHGTHERLLEAAELEAWAERLQVVEPLLEGPIYVLWGTDWEDAPVVNAAGLHRSLPTRMQVRWKDHLRSIHHTQRGSLASLFSKAASKGPLHALTHEPTIFKRTSPTAKPSSQSDTNPESCLHTPRTLDTSVSATRAPHDAAGGEHTHGKKDMQVPRHEGTRSDVPVGEKRGDANASGVDPRPLKKRVDNDRSQSTLASFFNR